MTRTVRSIGWRAALLAAVAVAGAGCSTLPTANAIPREGVEWIQPACTRCDIPTPEVALREAVGDDPQALEFARTVGAVESLLSRRPLLAGNDVELLVDGPATHAAQLEAIRAAKHHVHLDVYILTDEQVGQAYADALIERARAGVKVRLIFDSLGAQGASQEFRQRLVDAGVQIHEFNAINPLKDPRVWQFNRRSHRKLLVVDGEVAFTGGINISDDYTRSSSGSSSSDGSSSSSSNGASSGFSGGTSSGKGGKRRKADPESLESRVEAERGWRDTHIKVRGPAVAEFQRAFLATWQAEEGLVEVSPEYTTPPDRRGSSMVHVVTDRGEDFLQLALGVPGDVFNLFRKRKPTTNKIYTTYVTAIREARQRIWITQAYFVPDQQLLKLIKKAAKRGVDVRLLTPAISDVGLVPLASRRLYDELLVAGVRIYEYQPVMIHAKTAVIDHVWSTVGSANLDFRSFIHNDEANAVVIGREFGAKMETQFERDLQQSKEINLEEWRQRPLWEKLRERGASLSRFWI